MGGKLRADRLVSSYPPRFSLVQSSELRGHPPKTVSHHMQVLSRDNYLAELRLLVRAHFSEPSVYGTGVCVFWCLLLGVWLCCWLVQ